MINIVKRRELLDLDNCVVFQNADAFVFIRIDDMPLSSFDDLDFYVIKEIDSGEPEGVGNYIKTPYGSARLTDLSTGCKTVLMYLYYMRNKDEFDYPNKLVVFDVTMCGWNALEALFHCAEKLNDSNTIFLLEHTDRLYNLSGRQYRVNFEKTVTDPCYI